MDMLLEQWGIRLRRAREDLGLTQAELARRMRISPSTLCRAEAGTSNLDDANRVRAAQVLGVRVEDIWAYGVNEVTP